MLATSQMVEANASTHLKASNCNADLLEEPLLFFSVPLHPSGFAKDGIDHWPFDLGDWNMRVQRQLGAVAVRPFDALVIRLVAVLKPGKYLPRGNLQVKPEP